MFKVLWLLKRKAGISFEQFRNHYESSHALLGQKYLGHLIQDYKRNYDIGAGMEPPDPRSSGYDCITEWILPDEAALDEIVRLLTSPEVGPIFREDEAKFLDSTQTRMVRCDMRDTGSGDGAESLKLQGV